MKKRELSEFMTQELLYDYVNGLLDHERKKSVEEALEKSDDIKADLQTIERGIEYLDNLSKIDVSTILAQEVSQRITYFGQIKIMMSYENWPPFVKWTLEAVLVISFVIIVSLLAPWGQFKDFIMRSKTSDLILAELPKSESNGPSESLNSIEKVEKGHFEDEGEEKKTTKPIGTAPVLENPKTVAPLSAVTNSTEEQKKQGFVYRGILSIVNVEVGTSKLKDMIVELGGRKAGEVELGWRRNEGDYYFHFTIPESKFDRLQENFKTLGTVKLSKDPHPRIMPDGILRMIITTEESK